MWQVIYNITKKWWDRHKGTQNPSSCLTQCQTEKKFSPTLYKRDNPVSMTRRIQNARPCVEKMQFIFFVPSNEELEGTLHPQKFGCTPKNEGKRAHVPPDEKTCGHAVYTTVVWIDRDVWNRQYTRVGATLQIDIGSYSSPSFGDSRMINPWYIEFTLYALKQKILHLTPFLLQGF